MAYEKILAKDAADKFSEAVGLATRAAALAKTDQLAVAQIRMLDAYAMSLILSERWNTKGINDILERLDRIEQKLGTGSYGPITTLR